MQSVSDHFGSLSPFDHTIGISQNRSRQQTTKRRREATLQHPLGTLAVSRSSRDEVDEVESGLDIDFSSIKKRFVRASSINPALC